MYAVEQQLVVRREVIACLDPERSMEIAYSPSNTGKFLVTTVFLQISIYI